MKIWHVILLILFTIVGGFAYVVAGVGQESDQSAYAAFFPDIVSRAIQLRDHGEIRVPEINWYQANPDFPEAMVAARGVVRALYESKSNIDCTLQIEMPEVDSLTYTPALGTLISYRPLTYLVVFNGPPPDVTPFLSGNFLYIPPPPDGGPVNPRLPAARDLTVSYKIVSGSHRHGIAWHAEECPTFSYIVFEEK